MTAPQRSVSALGQVNRVRVNWTLIYIFGARKLTPMIPSSYHLDGLQIGGGITLENAQTWIDAGAAKVIVTSFLFPGAKFSLERLQAISKAVGKDRLVVDVSCRRRGSEWVVAMDKWQTMTDMNVNQESLAILAEYCSEFLVHAADVEGLCKGIDEDLVKGECTKTKDVYGLGQKHYGSETVQY